MARKPADHHASGLESLEKALAVVRDRFTNDEVDALKRVAARERAWIAIGYLGASLKTVLTYLGFFIGAYAAVKAGLIEWLRNAVG